MGMQTWDLRVTTTGDWTLGGLRAELPSGSFYNSMFGGNTSPHPALIGACPALAFDTYITAPGDVGSAAAPAILGGFPKGDPLSMTGSTISVRWGELVPDAPGLYQIARLTYPLGHSPAIHPQSYTSQVNPDATVVAPDWRVAQDDRWLPDAEGSWHDGANWSLGRPPLDGDFVTLDVGGANVRTVTHSQGRTILSGGTSHEHLLVSGGTLDLARTQHTAATLSITSGLTLAGGTLRGNYAGSPVTVGAAGGRLEFASLRDGLIVAPGARVDILSLGLSGSGTVNAAAVLRFASEFSSHYLRGPGTLEFLGGGVVQIDGGTTLHIDQTTLRGTGVTIGARTPNTTGAVSIVNFGRIASDAAGGSVSVVSNTFHNGGTLEAAAGAVLNVNSSTTTIGGSHSFRPAVIDGDGAVRVNGNVLFQGTTAKRGSGVLHVRGTVSFNSNSGTFDLSRGTILNDYTGTTPLPSIRAKIISGYNGGAWNGPGISSSTAASDPRLGVGYAEATELFTGFPATFAGETIDDTTLIVRLVRLGDANLDGAVDLRDFDRLAVNFGHPVAGWSQGDFNYDFVVNLRDFNLLAGNFGMNVPGPDVTPGDWAALASRVPEPACAWLACLGGTLAVRLRRSRCT
jgi:hypothetical protein